MHYINMLQPHNLLIKMDKIGRTPISCYLIREKKEDEFWSGKI